MRFGLCFGEFEEGVGGFAGGLGVFVCCALGDVGEGECGVGCCGPGDGGGAAGGDSFGAVEEGEEVG
ncbi:MAG: hypothetical protein ACF8R9_10920 [Phycisphaerales bacterium JB054]